MAKKHPKQHIMVEPRKKPTEKEDAKSYLQKKPVWSFKNLDIEHKKWGLHTQQEFDEVIRKMKSFEGMSWSEIEKASGGKRSGNGNNNHFEKVSSLIKEAQQRLIELKLDDNDQLFSLRISGTGRLYGILQDGVFRMLWFDKNHEIYQCRK